MLFFQHKHHQPRPRLQVPGFFGEAVRTVLFVFIVMVLMDMAIPRSLVDGRSMAPTFQDGDRIIVSRLNFMFEEPTRGDIIVFNSMRASEPTTMLIKRLIGLPGDTIKIAENQVYVNGAPLDEPYINEPCQCGDLERTLGANEYFVLGDNRNHSTDSRSFGVVTQDHIVGKVLFRYYPLTAIGMMPHQDYPNVR
jgi:signal peptidase I